MRNLQKITIFKKRWDSTQGVNKYEAEIFSASVFLRQTAEKGVGTAHTAKAEIRIPKENTDEIKANLGDLVAIGEFEEKPAERLTITAIADNWKGGSPHWHLTAQR